MSRHLLFLFKWILPVDTLSSKHFLVSDLSCVHVVSSTTHLIPAVFVCLRLPQLAPPTSLAKEGAWSHTRGPTTRGQARGRTGLQWASAPPSKTASSSASTAPHVWAITSCCTLYVSLFITLTYSGVLIVRLLLFVFFFFPAVLKPSNISWIITRGDDRKQTSESFISTWRTSGENQPTMLRPVCRP